MSQFFPEERAIWCCSKCGKTVSCPVPGYWQPNILCGHYDVVYIMSPVNAAAKALSTPTKTKNAEMQDYQI